MKFRLDRALEWVCLVAVAISGAIIFLFSTFQTTAEAEKRDQTVEKRLDRIELKQDDIINLLVNGKRK